MNFKQKLHLPVLFLVVVFLCNCNTSPKNETIKKEKVSEDSIRIVKLPYKNSNDLTEYEIPVLIGTTTVHGIHKRFYRHGSLYSAIPYINGKREGIAYTYYPVAADIEPNVWKEQPYVNNALHGICKRYHKNGKLQAEYEYKNGCPGTGMKEYSQSGKPVKMPTLIVTKDKLSAGFYITAHLSNNSEKVDYYIEKLEEGKFLPKGSKGLQVKKGLGEIVVDGTTKNVTITAVYITQYRNKYLVSKTIKL